MNNEYLQFENLEFSIAIGIMNDFFRAQLNSAKIEIRNTCQEKNFA